MAKRTRPWTKSDAAYLAGNRDKGAEELAADLGRTPEEVGAALERLLAEAEAATPPPAPPPTSGPVAAGFDVRSSGRGMTVSMTKRASKAGDDFKKDAREAAPRVDDRRGYHILRPGEPVR